MADRTHGLMVHPHSFVPHHFHAGLHAFLAHHPFVMHHLHHFAHHLAILHHSVHHGMHHLSVAHHLVHHGAVPHHHLHALSLHHGAHHFFVSLHHLHGMVAPLHLFHEFHHIIMVLYQIFKDLASGFLVLKQGLYIG